jgi:hypothetical protein
LSPSPLEEIEEIEETLAPLHFTTNLFLSEISINRRLLLRVSLFAEVHVKEAEDESEHCRPEAVAEATHPGDHTLDEALLVGGRVHRDESADCRVRDARRIREVNSAL